MAGVLAAAVVTDRSSRNTRKVCEQVNASYAEAARLIDQVNRLPGPEGRPAGQGRAGLRPPGARAPQLRAGHC